MEEVPEVSQTPRGGRKTYPNDLTDPTGGGWARRCAAGGLSWKIRSCLRKIAFSQNTLFILVQFSNVIWTPLSVVYGKCLIIFNKY